MPMELKLDEKGTPVILDGKPVYVDPERGGDIPVDVPGLFETLKKVNAESAGRRKELEDISAKLKPFDGLDPEKAKTALEMAANLDAGKLVEAGKVEELKKAVGASYEARISDMEKARVAAVAELNGKLTAQQQRIHNMLIKEVFDTSAFLRDNTVLPPDMAFNTFGALFAVEEEGDTFKVSGKLSGQDIYSRANPGKLATPEECIEAIINAYPMKDRIMKAAPGGSGTPQTGYNAPSDKNAMSSVERIAAGLKAKKMS